MRSDVLVLLREKRYEDVLARLYQARAESPDNVEIQKSIEQVKEFLIGAYAKRLGGLDIVAQPIPPSPGRSPDMVLLARYINGSSTYGDLAEMCPLGKLRTLQVLMEMYPRRNAKPTPEIESPHAVSSHAVSRAAASGEQLAVDLVDEPAPETAHSASPLASSASLPSVEDPTTHAYRDAFARGTAAFIQSRFADALVAFEACAELRPGDAAAAVMLRRVRRDLASL